MSLTVVLADIHWPKTNKKTLGAAFSFIKRNPVDAVIKLGDQFDNEEISHHNKKKIIFKERGKYKKCTESYEKEVLIPVEVASPKAEHIWIEGNHDFWERELVQEQPELEGTIERSELLHLEDRGWKVVPCGEAFRKGKLTFIHGETLTGVGNQASQYHAKKAVESYCSSVVYGHLHSPQTYTKVLPHDQTQKWQAYCMPILGDVNPGYLRNRPTAWLNGFGIVEFQKNGNFNVYQVIVSDGVFTFGGKTYSYKDK